MNSKVLLALATVSLVAVGCGKNSAGGSATAIKSGSGIIGGELATESDVFAKSVVAIYDVKVKGLCSGTIISKNLIVTAGHCAQSDASALRVIFGLDALSETRVVKKVAALTVNPGYAKTMDALEQMGQQMIKDAMAKDPAFDPQNPSKEFIAQYLAAQESVKNWGDIALLKLVDEIPAGFVPAKILASKDVIKDNSTVLLAGYGITHPQNEQPQSAFSLARPGMDVFAALGASDDDALALRKVEVNVKDSGFSPSEVLLDQTKGRGACHGDSGGPAYSEVNGELYVWGVTSRGIQDPTDSCGQYSAYTDMVDHRDWIVQTAAALGAEF